MSRTRKSIFPASSNFFTAMCALVLILLPQISNASSLTLLSAGAGATTNFGQYNTRNPIAVGVVTAIGGTYLVPPACLLIIAGTHLPTSPAGWQDLQDAFLAGLPQDLIVGTGGIPGVPQIPGTRRGYDNFAAAIEKALAAEAARCPKGSDLVIFAHSLGCMEAQRLLTTSLKDYNLIEADFFGCPELKELPEAARKVAQFFVMENDPIPWLGTILNSLMQDWRYPQNAILIPFHPTSAATPLIGGICGQIEAHLAYPQMPSNFKLTSKGDGSKTIADLHGYPANPFASLNNTVQAENACGLNNGSDEIKRIQEQNSRLPPVPLASH